MTGGNQVIRILQVLGGLNRGGAETMIMNLYRTIDRNEIQFDFIIHNASENAYVDEVKKMGGKIYLFPKFSGKNILQYRKHWLDFLLNNPDYHIVHSHVRSYATVFIPIAKRCGVKTIVHSHSTSNGIGLKGQMKTLMQIPLRWQADYLFACSEDSGKWLFGKKVVDKPNFSVVKNAIDVKKYRYDIKKRNQMRNALNIEGKRVYGHVGRLSEPKNHIFLIDIFREIHKRDVNAVLLIVGSGEQRVAIDEKIQKEKLQKVVFMLGARNDIPDIMQALDVFLFPSLWEGLPMTVVEAQAAGLPCLVSNTVTREVALSDVVRYLPISQGTDVWVNCAISAQERYPEAAEYVIQSGFDVESSAKWLTDYYRRMLIE